MKTEDELMKDGYTTFTRKLKLEGCINVTYYHKLKGKIVSTCRDIRQIIFRCQLFVNCYILQSNEIPRTIFSQNFWYTIPQLIIGKRPTSSKTMTTSLLSFWNDFKREHRNIVYRNPLIPAYSQRITEACIDLGDLQGVDKHDLFISTITIGKQTA
ncbi:hypothetical protein BDF21DRAFT_480351 [Thamnidium elegans]|nr:hypothetical protein BDF21DRAFT_480351 [Thamnidium elegans]